MSDAASTDAIPHQVDAISVEIEHPFTTEVHDLPLEAICITIEKNLLEILRRAESRELRPVPLSGLPPSERHHRDRADGRSSTLSARLSEEDRRAIAAYLHLLAEPE